MSSIACLIAHMDTNAFHSIACVRLSRTNFNSNKQQKITHYYYSTMNYYYYCINIILCLYKARKAKHLCGKQCKGDFLTLPTSLDRCIFFKQKI